MNPLPEVDQWQGGSSFMVKAHAGAKRNAIAGTFGSMLKVETTTAPEKGKANKAIIKLLADALSLSPSEVALISGDFSNKKRFGIKNMPPEELLRRFSLL